MLDPRLPPLPATPKVKLAGQGAIFSISAYAGKTAALGEALRVPLPQTPRRIEAAGVTYLWSGAASWLAMAADAAALAPPLTAAAPFAAIADQSDGKVVFTVIGATIRARLATLIPIDLHETAFPPDATALTLAGHIPIQIWRAGADEFALACFRSYAASLYHALIAAI